MNKFTYIVPTILKYPMFINMINKISQSDSIGEIIIINNSNTDFIYPFESKCPIKIIKPPIPQFCNGAWNIGAKEAIYDNIVLATEDIEYDIKIFELIEQYMETPKLGIIAMRSHDKLSKQNKITDDNYLVEDINYIIPDLKDISIEKITTKNRRWGYAFMSFMKKDNYIQIPEQLKQWYGDDILYFEMLIKGLEHYIIKSDTFVLKSKIGSLSTDTITQNRINEDSRYWQTIEHKYHKYIYD